MHLLLLLALLLPGFATAQPDSTDYPISPQLTQALTWRNIGPFRGGRATTATGVPGDPLTYYMGATGGGIWKTTDGGHSWQNVSDGHVKTGSVGAVAVAPSDPNVVWAGMGESPVRGVMSSHGDGIYRSTDAGQSWQHMGLDGIRQTGDLEVHPADPDVAWVAAQGNQWAPSAERGVYRTTDGGATWEQVLFVSDRAGAVDLALDPTNPRVLYAAFWDHQRLPWQVVSGGPGSSIWKTTDGGDTWKKLTTGLPDLMGKIGVAVSPADPNRVWAIVEAEPNGGLFRSDDGGKSWTNVNDDRVLRARSWYYMHVFADPTDAETVYVLNAPMLKSVDGGASFKPVPTPHGDNHDLWINPTDNRVMINANDGGANVSFNGGQTWSTQANQPTAQFYRVAVDNRRPYWIYGGQQDNSSVAIASATNDGSIGREDWHPVSGCESAWPAFDPDDPRYVYGGCYQGIIQEWDADTRESQLVMAYPYLGLGSDPIDNKYRFNWNAPIAVDPFNPTTIYHGGNHVLKSTDRGLSWQEISPDLTRNDASKLGKGGAPITNEAAGGETYHTIAYLTASPHASGTLWVGTDDGRVHLTRDEGGRWQDVTPPGLPESLINAIDVSPHDPATAYLAVSRHKFGEYVPYAFKTNDFGRTWTAIADGFPEGTLVRVIREDPERRGLLYAGTETGLWLSADDGATWQPFQRNLPVVPITDLVVHRGDLVAATQGRAFWVLDDLTPLHAWRDDLLAADAHLYPPRTAYRMGGGTSNDPTVGKNPPSGALLYYTLGSDLADSTTVKLEILRGDEVLRSYTGQVGVKAKPQPGQVPLAVKKGLNRHVWDYAVDPLTRVPDLFTYGSLNGYHVAPGRYTVRLTAGATVQEQPLEVLEDPRRAFTAADYADQQALLADIYGAIDGIHARVKALRDVKKQVNALVALTKARDDAEAVKEAGQALVDGIDAWIGTVVQPQQKTFQDVINFPNMLNAQLLYLMGAVDESPRVTRGAQDRWVELRTEWQQRRTAYEALVNDAIPAFNRLFEQNAIPAVILPGETNDQ